MSGKRKKNYSKEDLAHAVAEVRGKLLSYPKASVKYGIPITTIRDRIISRYNTEEDVPDVPQPKSKSSTVKSSNPSIKKEKDVTEGPSKEDTTCLPCLEMRIHHSGSSHGEQSSDDEVTYQYKTKSDRNLIPLDFDKMKEVESSEGDKEEEVTYQDQDKTVSVKKSLIDEYREKSKYYGPLRIISEKVEVEEEGESGTKKEGIQAKLQHVEIQATDNDGNFVNEHELKILMSQTPGIIPACDPESEKTSKDEGFIHLDLGNGEKYKVSKKAVSAFQNLAKVTPPFNTKIQKVFTTNEGTTSPVTIVTLYPRVDKVVYRPVSLNTKSESVERIISKKYKGRPRLVNYYRQNYINWAHRGNVFLTEIKKAGMDFLNEIIVENPVAEDSLRKLGLSPSASCPNLEPVEPPKEIEDTNHAVGSKEFVEEVWNYLTNLVRSDNFLIEFEFEMDEEKWLEIKRAFNMFQVNGEVIPDIVLKIVLKKMDDAFELSYYLRCVGRLVKCGQIVSKNDINDLLKCLAKDKYICSGIGRENFFQQVDQNEMLRLHLKEHCYLSMIPFESIHEKKCKAIVRDVDNTENTKIKRGSTLVFGPSVICQPCSLLHGRLKELMDPSLSILTAQEDCQRFIRHRYGPLHTINISENIKSLFIQTPSEFVSGVKRKLEREDDAVKQLRIAPDNTGAPKEEKPLINMTEEEFEKSIRIKKVSKTNDNLRKECEICQFQAKSMLALFIHMEDHLGPLTEKCDACNLKLSGKTALFNHRKLCVYSRKNFKCSECYNIFPTSEKLFEHMNCHRAVKPYTCGFCEISLQTLNEYKKHLKLIHLIKTAKQLNFSCNVCHAYFYTNDHLLIHKLNSNHYDKEHFKCKICNFSCSLVSAFHSHIFNHTCQQRENNNLAICMECKKMFFSSYRLENHMKKFHGTILKEKNNLASLAKDGDQQGNYEGLACSKCYKVYGTMNALQKHIEIYHSENVMEVPAAALTLIACTVCGRKFNSDHALTSHMKLHNANRQVFQCKECGFVYSKRNQVLEHIRNDHAEQVEKHQQMQQQQQQIITEAAPIYEAQQPPYADAPVLTIDTHNQIVQQQHPVSWNQLKIAPVEQPQDVTTYQFPNFNSQFF